MVYGHIAMKLFLDVFLAITAVINTTERARK
jgi:hypothetical protein